MRLRGSILEVHLGGKKGMFINMENCKVDFVYQGTGDVISVLSNKTDLLANDLYVSPFRLLFPG